MIWSLIIEKDKSNDEEEVEEVEETANDNAETGSTAPVALV